MIKNKQINVAIIEDHKNFREGLVHLLNTSDGFNCVGHFSSVELALENFPMADVLLQDINLPGKSGIEAIPVIKLLQPSIQIIMMTVFDDDDNIFNSILAGADGYLLKKTAPAKVLQSINDVMEGSTPMTPFVARRVLEHLKKKQSTPVSNYNITERETQILTCLVDGLDNKEIGNKLFISYDTVRNHLKSIYDKLHVSSRSQAVSLALKNRIIK